MDVKKSALCTAERGRRVDEPRCAFTLYITLIAAVAALGGLLFGFDTGVIAGAMLFVVPDFRLGPAAAGSCR